MGRYEQTIERLRARWGDKFVEPANRDKWARFMNSGRRVKVRHSDGTHTYCTISLSTGWWPCFLAIKTTRSLGGFALSPEDEPVAVQYAGKYLPPTYN